MNELAKIERVEKFDTVDIHILGDTDKPLWIAKDVCEALGIKNVSDALSDHTDDEKGIVLIDTLGGKQNSLVVTEEGLYRLIFNSRKPQAEPGQTHSFCWEIAVWALSNANRSDEF